MLPRVNGVLVFLEHGVWSFVDLSVVAGPKLYKPTATFFRSCPNLKRLSLTNADMTVHLPPSVGVLQLSHCSVSASLFTGCHNGTSRLREVKLRAVNLRSGSLAVLPSTVQRLAIHDSKIPCHCLPVANAPNPAAIIEIDLSDNHQIKPEEFSRIMAAWSPIKVLKISRCSFTSVDFFGLNTSHLQGLEALEMNDFAGLINSPIRYICRNGGRNLRRLSIAGCVRASPRAVLNIAEHQTSLQYLDVSRCPRLTDASFFVLFNLRRTLRYLNVANSNASADTVNALRLMMPNCEIVH